jgi:ABC-2 type transport system permease protein
MIDAVRLGAIARKEWIQLRRDPRSMALAFALPLFLLLFFGYAISFDVDEIRLVVLDRDRTAASRSLTQAFISSGYFTITEHVDTERDAADRLVRAQARGALVIPVGFERELKGGARAPVQLLLDGSDANTATIAMNYANAIVSRYSAAVLLRGRTLTLPLRLESRVWYNPELESRIMIVPGLIALIMSIIAALLTALTVAREWERGTMEQLAATPVSRVEVILGKLIPYLVIGLFDVVITVAAGMLIFDTPLRGNPLLLAGMTFLFLTGALGFGIFISAAVKSQVLATQLAMITTYLPAVLLSGFIYDIASMPAALRTLTFLIPARYFVAVTRGIFLKGVGIGVLWPEALLMIAFAALGLGLAVRMFKKEIG